MTRLAIGLVIGIVLMKVLSSGPLNEAAAAGSTNNQTTLSQADVAATVRQSIVGPLSAAGQEISDPETAGYYQKLVSSYGLDKIAASNSTSLQDLMPDVKKITESAMTLPLVEAGKQITDPDIARFYYDYLKQSGWNITPDQAAAR